MRHALAPLTVAFVFAAGCAGCSSSSAGNVAIDSGAPTDSSVDTRPVPTVDSANPAETSTSSDAGSLSVQTYTSSSSGAIDIQVNSHIVLGPTEAMVVDGQLLAADAQAVVAMVKASGRTLTTVYLTHAHPDHYAGFAVLQAAFPSAQFVTTPTVLADFQSSAPTVFAYLQSALGGLVASKLVTPTALSGTTITIDGQAVNVVELGAGESAHLGALALPGGGLIAGDLLYDEVHLFLGECHSAGWQQNLTTVKGMGFSTFYPGHGKSPVDATIFAATAQYITGAVPILETAEATDAGASDSGDPRVGLAVAGIEQKFPSYKSNYLVGYSASTFIDTNKCP